MKRFTEIVVRAMHAFLTAALSLNLIFLPQLTRAATVGGEIFLQGNYVEVGIHNSGSFGTSNGAPAGFHPKIGGSDRRLGFVVDMQKDGWTNGTPPQSGDFFVPGTPEEGWTVEWNGAGGAERNLGNYGLNGLFQIPKSSLSETTLGDTRSAVWEGVATSGSEQVKITKTIHFKNSDLFFVISTVMTNIGTTTLNSVEYMRNVDPDQEQPITGDFTTSNYVSNSGDRKLVVAKGLTHGITLGLGTIDSRARVSTEGFVNRDPDAIYDSPVTPSQSSPVIADQAISLAYRFGNLAPGQSVSFDYAYILNESDLETALSDLAAVTILQPTGTVSGSSVLFQATTDDVPNTTQLDFYVNDVLVGSDNSPDGGGVFEVSFDSMPYPNGTINLKVVATFAGGGTVEKTSTASVDNSGPPVSFSTPTAGQEFSPGETIPIAINVLDPDQPTVRVSFFRESVSSGSLFLGEDTTEPFESSFDVTGLPEGETVVIKAVANDSANRSTTIQVAGVVVTNRAPIAVDDPYSVNEDMALEPPAPGVLGNDSDADNNTLSAVLVSGPSNASSFSLYSDGSFSYISAANYNGQDSFTYKVNDGSLDSNTATVSITVNPINDAPGIGGGAVTRQQAAPGSISTIASAMDVDNSAATLTVSVTSLPAGITVTNITNNNGTISATVAAGCSASVGSNNVGLRVTDPDGSVGTGTLTVNVTKETTPPVIDPIANVTVQLPPNSSATSTAVSFPLPTATDNCGGPVTVTTDPVSGSVFNVGSTTVNVTATDQAGNQSTSSFTVTVQYSFSMFYYSGLLLNQQALNQVTAGSNVPVRFTLSGNKGYPYSSPPTSQQINCSTYAPIGAATVINRFAPDPYYSSLYDFYQTTWQTQANWKFTCRRLSLHMNDGTTKTLDFYFK